MKIYSPKNFFLSSLQISFLMKKLFTLILTALVFTVANAQLLTEDVSFSGLMLSANGWITTGTYTGTALSTTTGPGLTYAGFDGSGVGNAVQLTPSGEDLAKPISAPQTSGSVYLTFMVNVSAVTTTVGGYITGLTSSTPTTYNLRLFVKASGTGLDFGVSRSSGTPAVYTGNVYNLNQTYLVTCKYTFGTATAFDDMASIYVHPATPTLVEPAVMSATFSGGSAGADAVNINAIFARQGTAADAITAVVDGFRVATTWILTIPVEMTTFTAKKVGSANKLAWQTATEINNYYFDVERSNDGATFQNIGKVKGVGNTNTLSNYDFMDENPLAGTNYYRLQQVDVNGKTTTSKTVAVNSNGKGSVKVFPTLATDKLSVLTTSEKEEAFEIVNLAGQIVAQGRLTSSADVQISQLAKGNYVLKIAGDAVKFTKQ
jgi:hypothetical protein